MNFRVVVEVNLKGHREDWCTSSSVRWPTSPQIVHCVSTTGQADYILTVLMPTSRPTSGSCTTRSSGCLA